MATKNYTRILVFKTNINTEADKYCVANSLNNHPLIEEWSVDTEDIDKVLRIVSQQECTEIIIQLINKNGYQCQELD